MPKPFIWIDSIGGQTAPIWTTGSRAEWKNAQKKLKKSNASETIKNQNAQRILDSISIEVLPKKVNSRIKSRHQKIKAKATKKIPKKKQNRPLT